MVATYIPGFTPELQNVAMLPQPMDGGGPAYASITPSAPPTMSATTAAPNRATGFGSPVLQAFYNSTAQQPAATAAQPAGLTFLTDRGRQAGYGKGSSGFVAFDPNAQYRMWDERGKNRIVSSGTGQSGLEAIHALANQYNKEQGKKANYGIERLDPATGKWVRILENDPAKNIAGKIADVALPAIGTVLGGPLGGAIGSGLSSAAQGRSLKSALLRAGLTAATAGIMDKTGATAAISGALGGGASAVPSSAVASTLGSAAGDTAGNLASNAVGEFIVNGVRQAGTSALASGLASAATGAIGSVAGGALANALPSQPTTEGSQFTVTGQRPPLPTGFNPGPLGAAIPNLMGTPVQTPDLAQKGNTLDDVVKYLRAAGLLTSVVGGALGGKGGQGTGTIPGGFNGLSPVFSGGLPAPTIPGASTNFAQRPVDADWKRYGYGPGQSFFDYVPQGQPNTSNAYTGYAEGGEVEGGMPMAADSFAVQGVGDGRDDRIPALLSDGEYVFDAETVALLGDGSTKAGADALDAFRVNIRKHKGQQLARGGFSADAKRPEQYLQGGLT
jgi:hypothetical protein